MTGQPFIRPAMLETYFRDVRRLREAIREHDPVATEEAWDRFERWIVTAERVDSAGNALQDGNATLGGQHG